MASKSDAGKMGAQVGGSAGEAAGGHLGESAGMAVAGPVGAVIGKKIGSKLGKQAGQKLGKQAGEMSGEHGLSMLPNTKALPMEMIIGAISCMMPTGGGAKNDEAMAPTQESYRRPSLT